MDQRPDLMDLVDVEADETAYEPGWYSILKETSEASVATTAPSDQTS